MILKILKWILTAISKSFYSLIISSIIIFGVIKASPNDFTISQSKELLKMSMTSTFGLTAIFIASIFSAFNSKEHEIVDFISRKHNEVMIIGSILNFAILGSFLIMTMLVLTDKSEIKASLVLIPLTATIFSIVYMIQTATSILTQALRIKYNEINTTEYQLNKKRQLEKNKLNF